MKQNYDNHSLPLDALWNDIDYMYKYYDFTIDTERYNITQMNEIYNLSSPLGLHWVPIIDVGIALGSDAQIVNKMEKKNEIIILRGGVFFVLENPFQ